ncbi:MAG: hypothetical protein ABEH38_03740 [Flavobacteriales bacterium]
MRPQLHLFIIFLLLTSCRSDQEGSTEGSEQKDLQRYESYILEWKGKKELPPDHHFLFLGIGAGCPGCSHLFIEEAEEVVRDQDSLSVVILLRHRRAPNALSWVEDARNARFETRVALMDSSQELPYPIYLHTDSSGTFDQRIGLKEKREEAIEALGW